MVKKKVLIEILSVLIILSLALSHMLSIFYYTDISGGGFRNFYATKKDSIDVMIYGSSHAACTVDNNLLWEKAGISSFTLSSGSQPLESTYYYMKESFKYQKPKVAFVETLQANNQSLNDDGTYQSDMGTLYRSDLGMKWSLTYAEMIRAQSKLYGLDTNRNYRNVETNKVYGGDELMELGFYDPIIRNDYAATMYHFKAE